jgi:threonine/homoserine/homoserine lactone efflux protein
MDVSFFWQGLAIGFSIAAPVGPIGVLCIRRTLAAGMAVGFVSGLGAALADAIYGAMAAFGLTALTNLLVSQQTWLRIVGGLYLCYLGVKTFVARPADKPAEIKAGSLVGAFFSTLLLTLTNPATIVSFIGVFAGFGLGAGAGSYSTAGVMVAGVFLGSAFWWLLLSGGVGCLRDRFDARKLTWVNRFSGLVILTFGLAALFVSKR